MKLFKHQEKAIAKSRDMQHFALFFEQGTGKTATVIEMMNAKIRQQNNRYMNALIIAPVITLRNWKRELYKWQSYLANSTFCIDQDSGKKRVERIKKGYDLFESPSFIINYESLLINDVWELLATRHFSFCVLDESHKIKNLGTKRTQKCMSLGNGPDYKYILSGTPILNSLEDIYSQFKFLDGFNIFGKKNEFVYKYFNVVLKTYRGKDGKPKQVNKLFIKAGKEKEIHEIINQHGSIVHKKDCLDLPPLLFQQVYFNLSPACRTEYEKMKTGILKIIDENVEIKAVNIFTMILKLQQITCGWIHGRDTAADDDYTYRIDDHRLGILSNCVELQKENGVKKIIVWTVFKHDYYNIQTVAEKYKYLPLRVTGNETQKEKQRNIDRFQNSDEHIILISNPKAGGIGINLTSANVMIFYNRTYSLEDLLQAQARFHRIGSEQHKSLLQIDIVARNTIDEDIYKRLAEKKKLSDSVLVESLRRKSQ